MKLALLGLDTQTERLSRAAADLGHEIIWAADVGTNSAIWAGACQDSTQWEILCDANFCDGVLLGRGEEDSAKRLEQLLQLAKSGIAVLSSFPLFDSLLNFYEADLARIDSRAVLHHFNPVMQSESWVAQMAAWAMEGHPEVGANEQIVWERPLEDRSQASVLRAFARDVELIDRVAGPLDRLGAGGAADSQSSYAGLHLQLLSKGRIPVLWNVTPPVDRSEGSVTLVGGQGKRVVPVPEQAEQEDVQAKTAIERFEKAVRGGTGSSTWPSALRAMELADTIEISLRRGRIIDVHRQQLTEELSFRGTMSAIGCGVLLLVPPLLLVLGWLAGRMGLPNARFWAPALLALLVIFLVLQLLPKLLLPARHSAEDDDTSEDT